MEEWRLRLDDLEVVDVPAVEPAATAWARRLDTRRPLCVDVGQLAHHAAAVLGKDLELTNVALWQREYHDLVLVGGFGLNPAARRRRVPMLDPAIEGAVPGVWHRWDATAVDPPRSTWLPGNTARDLWVLVLDAGTPIDVVTLAGDRIDDDVLAAVRDFVGVVDWAV